MHVQNTALTVFMHAVFHRDNASLAQRRSTALEKCDEVGIGHTREIPLATHIKTCIIIKKTWSMADATPRSSCFQRKCRIAR